MPWTGSREVSLDNLWEPDRADRQKLATLLEEPGWAVAHQLKVLLLQEYNSRALQSKEQWEVAKAQGAYEALMRFHNMILDATKEDKDE